MDAPKEPGDYQVKMVDIQDSEDGLTIRICATERIQQQLKSLAEPLQRWLAENFDPHCKIEITVDRVDVFSEMQGGLLWIHL